MTNPRVRRRKPVENLFAQFQDCLPKVLICNQTPVRPPAKEWSAKIKLKTFVTFVESPCHSGIKKGPRVGECKSRNPHRSDIDVMGTLRYAEGPQNRIKTVLESGSRQPHRDSAYLEVESTRRNPLIEGIPLC